MLQSSKLAQANEEADNFNRIGLSAIYKTKKEIENRTKRSDLEYKAFIFGNIPYIENWQEGDGNAEKFEEFVMKNKPNFQTFEEAIALTLTY